MPLNDHNSIELVPTTTKVPAPFVVALAPYNPKKLRIWSRLTGLYSLASRPTS